MKTLLKIAAPLILFAAVAVWVTYAISAAGKASEGREMDLVKTTIENGVTMCYSIEGAYPESLVYLKENYGINYDEEKYIVHYERFASNIRPAVTVIGRDR